MRKLVLLLSLAASLAGCSDGEGGGEPADAGKDAGSETFVAPDQLGGSYLLVVSTTLAPRIPVLYLVEIEAEADGDQLALRMRQRPLSKVDRKTPVGPWGEWNESSVDAEGHFESPTLPVTIPADANAVTSLDSDVEIGLSGMLEAVDEPEPVTFMCGDVSGRIIGPIPVDDLRGSTYTATRIEDVEDPDSYPEAVINCDHDPARPL